MSDTDMPKQVSRQRIKCPNCGGHGEHAHNDFIVLCMDCGGFGEIAKTNEVSDQAALKSDPLASEV